MSIYDVCFLLSDPLIGTLLTESCGKVTDLIEVLAAHSAVVTSSSAVETTADVQDGIASVSMTVMVCVGFRVSYSSCRVY